MAYLQRNFYPVGQGLFCSEILKDSKGNILFCVVYDCGTNTKNHKQILGKQIAQLSQELNGSPVDILFLSHMHNDHVNGFDLLSSKVKIKRIVLPQVTPLQRINAFVYAQSTPYRGLKKIREGLWDGHYGDVEVTAIIPFDPDIDTPQSYVKKIGYLNLSYQQNGNDIVKYVPFYYEGRKDKDFIRDLMKQCPNIVYAAENGKLDTIDNIRNIRKTLKPLYERHYGGLNESSMPVLSINSGMHKKTKMISAVPSCCLYTGDYSTNSDPQDKFITDFYRNLDIDYWKKINTMQSPHHGSNNDNPNELYSNLAPNTRCIISYGATEIRQHRDITFSNIKNHNCIGLLLTEKDQTI
ncbi:MAG: MBL fold metallo-hydrolase [Bacteroidales bacterium]|nr:MBL fold metallo-hydrolase [Bacteroidales bacterium]